MNSSSYRNDEIIPLYYNFDREYEYDVRYLLDADQYEDKRIEVFGSIIDTNLISEFDKTSLSLES